MSELPPELLHEILMRLPPDDLIRCLAVSKAWNSFIRQPSFIKSHLQRSLQTDSDRIMVMMTRSGEFIGCCCTLPFEDDEYTFAAVQPVNIEQPLESPGGGYSCRIGPSVHGLLCLVNRQRKLFAFWNPSIQKCKIIPFPTTTMEVLKSQSSSRCYGFGYDSVNDDHKLVYITFTAECQVTNVYSLKHNSWKMMIRNNIPHCCRDGFFWDGQEALFSGGAVCWMMSNKLDVGRRKYVILTFDLATEEHVEFRIPVDVYQVSRPILVALGGFLCIRVFYCVGVRGWKQNVWIMNEYGVVESWTLLCSMLERVLLMDIGNRFYWYDIGEKISRQVHNPGLKYCYGPTICVRSLCLLDGDPVIR